MNNRLAALLHDHFGGLLEFSDIDESELQQMASQLTAITDPCDSLILGVLEQCQLSRWRLGAGFSVWDGQAPSSSFVLAHGGALVDAWIDANPLVSRSLISEILRVL